MPGVLHFLDATECIGHDLHISFKLIAIFTKVTVVSRHQQKVLLAFTSATFLFHIRFAAFLNLLVAEPFNKSKVRSVPVPFIYTSESSDRRVGNDVISGSAKDVVKTDTGFHLCGREKFGGSKAVEEVHFIAHGVTPVLGVQTHPSVDVDIFAEKIGIRKIG